VLYIFSCCLHVAESACITRESVVDIVGSCGYADDDGDYAVGDGDGVVVVAADVDHVGFAEAGLSDADGVVIDDSCGVDDDDDDDGGGGDVVDGLTGVADLVPAGDIADDGGERLGSGVGGDGGVMNEDDGCCGSSTGTALLGVSNPDDDDDDDDTIVDGLTGVADLVPAGDIADDVGFAVAGLSDGVVIADSCGVDDVSETTQKLNLSKMVHETNTVKLQTVCGCKMDFVKQF